MMRPIHLAILGCGAIACSEHIPAAALHPRIELTALVDTDLTRAQGLIRTHGLSCKAVSDYHDVFGQVDAIINALPNHLHLTSNQDCLSAGLHVLCEKPLAITAAEARSCTELAEQKNLVLAVGMNRRFAASHRLLRLVMHDGLLGKVLDYDFQYGGVFDWNSATGFYFDCTKAGGGALMDFGIHMLDSVLDWFGPVSCFDYWDDDWGSGVEANVLLDVRHEFGAIPGRLRISRTFGLKNRLLVRGSSASAEISTAAPETVVIHRPVDRVPVSQTLQIENFSAAKSYFRQLDNFVACIIDGSKPEVDGWQAIRTLELIENCYAHKRRIPEPWTELDMEKVETPT